MQPFKAYFVLLFILLSSQAFGQELPSGYSFQSWSLEEGLPSGSIKGLAITDDGFLWISTRNGLVRFDGFIKKDGNIFTMPFEGKSAAYNSFNSAPIYSLNEDEFILVRDGKGEFLRYKDQSFSIIQLENRVLWPEVSSYVDSEGRYWFVSGGIIHSFQNGNIKQHFPELNFKDYKGVLFKVISDQEIWWKPQSQSRLYRYKEGKTVEVGSSLGLTTNEINAFTTTHSGNIWIHTVNGLELIQNNEARLVLDNPTQVRNITFKNFESPDGSNEHIVYKTIRNNKPTEYLIIDDQIMPTTSIAKVSKDDSDIILNSPSSVWSTTQLGAKVLTNDKELLRFERLIQASASDKRGGLWFVGLNTLNYVHKTPFSSYEKERSNVFNTYSLLEDHEGVIWATKRNSGVVQNSGDQFSDFRLSEDLSKTRIYSIMEDKDQNLWFGADKEIFRWDRNSEPEKITSADGINFKNVRGLLQSKDGTIWAADLNNVLSYSKGEWKNHEIIINSPRNFTGTFIYEDLYEKIWVGTFRQGLFNYNEEIDRIEEFEYDPNSIFGEVRSLFQDSDSTYWIGLNGMGLLRLEVDKDLSIRRSTHFDKSNGFHGMVINSINEDEFGRIWIGSNTGIFWISKLEAEQYSKGYIDRISSTLFHRSDGLPGMETNGGYQSSTAITDEGNFIYAMMEGIGIINPGKVLYDQNDLNINIHEFSASDSVYSHKISSPVVSKNNRDLQFKFAAYNFELSPENIKYRYKLSGYNEEWIEVTDRQEAFYTNVPGGDYTFIVEAAYFGYDWTGIQSEMSFTISRFFYETLLFKLLMLLFGISVVYAGVQWRIRASEQRALELKKQVDEQTLQLVEQAEQLKELDKAKSRFFTNISHEFRTPLSLIIGPLEELSNKQQNTNDESSGKLNLAIRSSKRLLKLINEVLDISKLESNFMKPVVKRVPLADMLSDMILEFTPLAEANEIQLVDMLGESESTLYVDPGMMEKVFTNLLSNALKFTPASGKVTITAEESESELIIEVKDTGEGIKEEELNHVFDRFYQTDESSKGNQVGTGIGLALVKELVELHHGEISAESTFGEGATFIVRLQKGKDHFDEDLSIDDSLYKPASFVKERPSYPTERPEIQENTLVDSQDDADEQELPCILLVDDNEDIRFYLKEHFSKGYKVFEAENGKDGLDLATLELPDVIISDVMMPVMDGFQFTKELRSNKETDFIPVLLLTAKSDVVTGLETGVEDYIVKPFDVEEVKLRVRNLLRSRKVLTNHLAGKGNMFKVSDLDVKSEDVQFLEQVLRCIEDQYTDEQFGVVQLSYAMAMSRVTLHSKLKSAISKSPSELIREFRLERARQLLSNKAGNVSEVAYSVGFKSVAQFSRAYKEQYNSTPSEALEVV